MNDFETKLWASVVSAAHKVGMEYTVPCSHNVRDFIRAGVGAMRRQGRTDESDFDEAAANLDLLSMEMIRAARELETNGKAERSIPIRETALVRAKQKCPLWPFG